MPYLTQADELDFVEPSVALVVARELALSWREYLIELRALLTRWAKPAGGQDRKRTRSAAEESAAVRQQVARLLGEMMKIRVDDVMPFLEDFATFDDSVVRRAATEAIVHAFGSTEGARNARNLLREWETDRSGEDAAVRKREVAANTCWRIAALGQEVNFAIAQLHRHTRDVPRVRAMVAYGLSKIITRCTTHDVLELLARLAADQHEIARRRTGVALADLLRRAPADAHTLIAEWLAAGPSRRLWTATYALMVSPRPSKADRDKLLALMDRDAAAFCSALASALTPGDEARDTDKSEIAVRNILRLAADEELAAQCTTAIGTYWAISPDRGALLCERLGHLDTPPVNDILIAACKHRLLHAATLSDLLQTVLADASAGGTRQQVIPQAISELLSEWGDELEPSADLLDAWIKASDLFERFFRWLRTEVNDVGPSAVVRLRRLILESQLDTPKQVVVCAAGWLKTKEIRSEASQAIRELMSGTDWAKLAAPLVAQYWTARAEVWSVLDVCDAHAAELIRQVAFQRLLIDNPRRFVAAAIEETQSFPQVKSQVLKALADLATEESAAIGAAIRDVVADTSRKQILALLSDFGAADPSLQEIAKELWLTRGWLSVRQFFANS